MRSSAWLGIVLCAALAAGAVYAAPAPSRAIQKITVIVRTGDDFGASTEEAVWFSLGPSYEWVLSTPGRTPFRNNATDVFHLPPNGLRREDIKWVKLRKSYGGDWLLQGIEVWIDGRPYYRNPEINTWFEGNRLDWVAPNFPPPAAPRRSPSAPQSASPSSSPAQTPGRPAP